MTKINYVLIRENRKSIRFKVKADGTVEVHAPRRCPRDLIEAELDKRREWIEERRAQEAMRKEKRSAEPKIVRVLGEDWPVVPSQDGSVEIEVPRKRVRLPEGFSLEAVQPALKQCYTHLAKQFLPPRVAHWAKKFGLTVNRVGVTDAAKRWGSCSGRGNLNFSWRLMRVSPRAIDAVIIHELMHRIQLNHSPEFRRLERENTPEFEACRKELMEEAQRMREE